MIALLELMTMMIGDPFFVCCNVFFVLFCVLVLFLVGDTILMISLLIYCCNSDVCVCVMVQLSLQLPFAFVGCCCFDEVRSDGFFTSPKIYRTFRN